MKFSVNNPTKPRIPVTPQIAQPFRFGGETKFVYIRCLDQQGKRALGTVDSSNLFYCMGLHDGQIYSVNEAMAENIILLNDSQVVFTDLNS